MNRKPLSIHSPQCDINQIYELVKNITMRILNDSGLLKCDVSPLKIKALHSFKVPGSTHTTTQCHIPET
jgi:hypothetical protein